MKHDKKEARRIEIEVAAYKVFKEKGYKGASMLAIAKQAKASNETLYKWYGTKSTLFSSMVKENAKEAKKLLEDCLESNVDPLQTIQQLGPILLKIVTGEKAIILNRAAVGDVYETGTLGKTIAAGGKEAVTKMLAQVFDKARSAGLLQFEDAQEVANTYIALLIGDLQIERVIGVRDVLSADEMKERSDRAYDLILRLFSES
ncbi:MAG: TetR/AcrR family transcriptional regulator [Rhodospirillales bacterium]|nr:TetR/AcrR family transcriptional regulator [Rhodospirillales bacterium]